MEFAWNIEAFILHTVYDLKKNDWKDEEANVFIF